jgi:hypothetical protein
MLGRFRVVSLPGQHALHYRGHHAKRSMAALVVFHIEPCAGTCHIFNDREIRPTNIRRSESGGMVSDAGSIIAAFKRR